MCYCNVSYTKLEYLECTMGRAELSNDYCTLLSVRVRGVVYCLYLLNDV